MPRSKRTTPMRVARSTGFTLIELMVVVAVVAILGAIAYPSYQAHINKSRRADAQVGLVELAQFMERHYTSNGGYLSGGNTGGAPTLPFTSTPKGSGNSFYALSLSEVSAQAYVLQAVPENAMSGDKCGTLTLSHTGVRGQAAGLSLRECWGR